MNPILKNSHPLVNQNFKAGAAQVDITPPHRNHYRS